MRKISIINTILVIAFFMGSCIAQNQEDLSLLRPIIPTPQEVVYGKELLRFNAVSIVANGFESEAELLKAFFRKNKIETDSKGVSIEFSKNPSANNNSEEWYSLEVSEKILITAKTSKGIFYAIQSLRQLFRFSDGIGSFPQIAIADWPAFKIRGFMHDTGRNFQSIEQLKEQIEVLAQYKYNVFHWHLTDNPGWRLESKKYPELQSKESMTRQKGKFYSQTDFMEVLSFCKERKITVIPELDIPGHTEAFRKALGIKKMSDPKVKPILLDLFSELLSLADATEVSYIHIGTDEVKTGIEHVSTDVIFDVMNLIKNDGREVIVWKQGIQVKEDKTSINQLWAQHEGRKGHRFIDSRANYINHLDPFAGVARLFFQQPCRQPTGDSMALGGVLCAWPDNNIGHERDVLIQNPIYPSMVFYADAIWKGRRKDYPEYWAKLPAKETQEFKDFQTFEKKVTTHRDLYFKGKEFQYVAQADMEWKLIGPFDHKGDFEKSFPVEEDLNDSYSVNGKTFSWSDSHVGATIHLKHFFGFQSVTKAKKGTYYATTQIYSPNDRIQDFWIGFQGWSRSSRRGGPTPKLGEWHFTKPKIWVNDTEISPPVWKQPSLGENTHEIPFVDEDYFYRTPTKVTLKKGWNKILLKIPQGGESWKWMFTCVPIEIDEVNVREASDLNYNPNLEAK